MVEITIGEEAINRAGYSIGGYTYVLKGGPANASGEIATIEIYAVSGYDLEGCKVGIFYPTNGDTLKCRSAVTIGEVTGGSKQIIPLDPGLTVEIGDYIGFYWTPGRMERDSSGGGGVWYNSGNHCIVNDEDEYNYSGNWAFSLFGKSGEGVEHTHTPSDTLAMSDNLSAMKIIHHSGGDTLVIGDSLGTPEMTFNVELADTMSMSDSITVAMTFNVALADTLGISDLVGCEYLVAFTTPTEDLRIER